MTRDWYKALMNRIEPGCEIGMETCSGAHHWARLLQARGYTVKLVAPQFVKPYVKRNKNNANDAEAIWEAMSRPHMYFKAIKTVEQQDVQAVHRVRASLIDQRKAKGNQIRGLTSEYGLVAPKELLHLRAAIPRWLKNQENGLSERFGRLLRGLWQYLLALDERVQQLDQEIEQIARQDPVAVRLQQLRRIGPVTAIALLATAGDASQFASGRQMAVLFGLTPKQNSSGRKEYLLGISKRGDAYLRSLLVHGARAVIRTAQAKGDRLSIWVMRIATTRHPNIAAVAVANKTARIPWTMMTKGTDCQPEWHKLSSRSTTTGVSEPCLHDKPHDSQQVEPALTKPVNV